MIKDFRFSINFINSSNKSFINCTFKKGMNVIYGESSVGKSELIKYLGNSDEYKSNLFSVKDQSIIDNIQVIQQNPDQQIISNTVENELAFNLECGSNNVKHIQKEFEKTKNKLLFKVDLNRHPVTLSGGEKELLNINTTLSLKPYVIMIDDALSFLNEEMKMEIITQLSKLKNSIILWFTSDSIDLQYGKTKWEMIADDISEIKSVEPLHYPKSKFDKSDFKLQITNLNFYYSETEPVFNDFSEIIESFRCLGIIGNNGIGKSTLGSLILGIEKPISGSVKLFTKTNDNPNIGYLDQFPEKLLGISQIDELVENLIHNKKLKYSSLKNIESDLKVYNINWDDVKTKTGLEFSWTKLRFILICILSNCIYDILILDEPTFGMGNQEKLILQSHFIRYLSKKHLILISHDKLFINSLCDSIIEL